MSAQAQTYTYPQIKKDQIVDNYHGQQIKDPYRHLEDPDSSSTIEWVNQQNQLTQNFIKGQTRQKINKQLTTMWNYPRYSLPSRSGNYYFFWKNSGLQNQPVLYIQESLQGDARVLLDPNQLSKDGTISISTHKPSDDGKLMAYGLSQSGSDWQEIRIKNTQTLQDFDEVIKWTKFTGIAWTKDNKGFFYNRFPETGTVSKEDEFNYSKVYWHEVGTPQSKDILVYERPDAKELNFYPFITEDGQYLVLHIYQGTSSKNRIYYRKINDNGPFVKLLDDNDADYSFIGNQGPKFYFRTDKNAPRKRMIAIDLSRPDKQDWQEIIPEGEDIISFASLTNKKKEFVVVYLHNAHHLMKRYDLNGKLIASVELPTIGSVSGMTGKEKDTEIFISFTSFLYPSSVFRYDFKSQKLSMFRKPAVNIDASQFETRQVFYPSKDGTKVSMFITHKKGIKLDGSHPTLLYGYGGFNLSLTPAFSISRLNWIQQGGIFVLSNLRGGGEYGESWHKSGMLEKKQNVFDDFISAGEWLIANKYTSTSKLAIQGGSNGGLLVAATMLQRPDLFGAVICQVPVIDMLRYHKFTVGRYWVPEYGNAEKDPEHFKFMYAYSPLHNVKKNIKYPPILVTTADTDDRVVPLHAKKYVATLQEASNGENLILLRVETKAGHGSGKPTSKVIDEQSDIFAFLYRLFEMKQK